MMVHPASHAVRRNLQPSAQTSSLPRIAVVDDSRDFVSLLCEIFAGRFEVTGLSHQSMDAIAGAQPALLIVDNQPASGFGLGAWQIVGLAREHPDLQDVPIIVCTTDYVSLVADGERSAEHENVHLMAKPFALEVLEKLVARLVPGAPIETLRAAI
jgi:CheY-like chemotaxis protein